MIYLLSPLKKEGTVSLPMISFEIVVDSIDFSNIDTLIFTSKQAVVTADTIDKSWKNYPSIAIGGATQKKIEELGGNVIYHPKEFYGKSLADDIKSFFRDKKLLYLRPKEVSFNSRSYLANSGIELKEQIIYQTSCVNYQSSEQPKKDAIIIFTSPSTINCFFKNFIWDKSYRAVLIGNATKEHLPTGCRYEIADVPLIDACVTKAREMEFNN